MEIGIRRFLQYNHTGLGGYREPNKERGESLTGTPTPRQLLCSLPLPLPFCRTHNTPILNCGDQKRDVGIEKMIPNVSSPKGYVIVRKLMAIRVHEATTEIIFVESVSGHFSHSCCISPCRQTDVGNNFFVVGHAFLNESGRREN